MNTKLTIKGLLAAALAASTLTFAPAVSAQDLELNIGRDGPSLRLREACDPRRDYCGPRRGDEWDRDRRVERGGCTEARALDKAERMGLRRVSVLASDRRVIEVGGRQRDGDRVVVAFSRSSPRCPLLG